MPETTPTVDTRQLIFVLAAAVALIIDIAALAWYSYVIPPGYTVTATGTSGSWGPLAIIAAVIAAGAALTELVPALSATAAAAQPPSRSLYHTRVSAAGAALLCVLIKMTYNTDFLAYGAWVAVILAVALLALTYPNAPPASVAPPPHAQASPQQALPAEANRFAIASLVLSILWLAGFGSLAAIVCADHAKAQIRAAHGGQSGDGLATAGYVIGVIGIVGAVAFWALILAVVHTGSSYPS
jgi:hypothetical protein